MAALDALSAGSLPTSLRAALAVPFRPRTYGRVVYLALAFPLGLAYFVAVTVCLSVGVGLSVVVVGVPLVLATLVGVMGVATAERALAERLLGAGFDAPDWKAGGATGVVPRLVALVTDVSLWAALVFVLSKLFVGVAAFTLLVTLTTLAGSLLAAPLYYDTPGASVGLILAEPVTRELSVLVPWDEFAVGLSVVVRLTSWEVTTLSGALAMSLVGVGVLFVGLNALNVAGWLCARWARLLLGHPPRRAVAGLRRRLAER